MRGIRAKAKTKYQEAARVLGMRNRRATFLYRLRGNALGGLSGLAIHIENEHSKPSKARVL